MDRAAGSLRKAAVLMRSVDADTAAMLLAQLSPEEAAAVREAMRSVGPVDAEEQEDLLSEFRRSSPAAAAPQRGVELALSSATPDQAAELQSHLAATQKAAGRQFEFLEQAPIRTLVPYLAREHAQTVAVVLSHLEPSRAAAVLAELPPNLQVDTLERLANLGETDAETVRVLEHELARWMKHRESTAENRGRRKHAVASILSAADPKTRERIVGSIEKRNATLAGQLRLSAAQAKPPHSKLSRDVKNEQAAGAVKRSEPDVYQVITRRVPYPRPLLPRPLPVAPSPPAFAFENLIYLDSRALARVLQAADPNVLALALAGSSDELVDRICDQMPKRTAKTFRRELRRLGPTRLSDVEAAQGAVAQIAARQIAERRNATLASPPNV